MKQGRKDMKSSDKSKDFSKLRVSWNGSIKIIVHILMHTSGPGYSKHSSNEHFNQMKKDLKIL